MLPKQTYVREKTNETLEKTNICFNVGIKVIYSMETCLCRQTLKIKDLYQICIYFCEKWFKLKVKQCRIIAQEDFWIELILYWEPTIRIYSYSCIKSVFSSTVKHNFGSILVSSIRYSLIGYVCITH